MDQELIKAYIAALEARPILERLPPGLREHCLQFEQMCLDDLKAQIGVTDEQVSKIEPYIESKIPGLMSIAGDFVLSYVKKHWPAATIASAVSAVATYLLK